jgi:hypothetical protein
MKAVAPPQSVDRPALAFLRGMTEVLASRVSPGKRADSVDGPSSSQSASPLAAPPPPTSPDPVLPMNTKVCVKCKQEKPLLDFHKNSRSADGLHSYCKECNRAQALAHIKAEKARKALLRAAKKAATSTGQ